MGRLAQTLGITRKHLRHSIFTTKVWLINMKKVPVLIPLLLGASIAFGQSEWVSVASTDDMEWEFRSGSFEETVTKGGESIFVALGRVTGKIDKKIDLRKSYVSVRDCARKMGKVVTLGIDGSFRFENDFVFGGGNVASAMAEFLCGVQEYRVKNREKKGI